MTNTPTNAELLVELREMLTQKQRISQATMNRLMIHSMVEILRGMDDVRTAIRAQDVEIKTLRRNSVLLWVQENRILSALVGLGALVVLDILQASGGWRGVVMWVAKQLGVDLAL